jgi:hypothetical protein
MFVSHRIHASTPCYGDNFISLHAYVDYVRILQKTHLWRMVSSGMLRREAFVRPDVSEELSASFIRVTRIGELRNTLAVNSNRRTLRRRATRRNIPEDATLLVQEQFELGGGGGVQWKAVQGAVNKRGACQLQLALFLVHRFLLPWWRRC